MVITFMGTGTSLGVPIIGCGCAACQSSDFRDKRTRSSALVEHRGKSIVIDTGPDFRAQCLSNHVSRIDAVLITHTHRDHVAGLDDIRPFCYKQGGEIPVYASEESCQTIRRSYDYCFAEPRYPGVPEICLKPVKYFEPFRIGESEIVPIPVMHGKMQITAWRIGGFAYITDANRIPEESMKAFLGTRHLVLNALGQAKHHSHFSLAEALEVIKEVAPVEARLTHIGHSMGLHAEVEKGLPGNVRLAYDSLRLEFPDYFTM